MTSSTTISSETPPYSSTGRITLVSSSTSGAVEQPQTAQTTRVLKNNEISHADFVPAAIENEFDRSSPIERVYPHLFDDAGPANQARIFIRKAIRDVQHALESYGEADLESVGSRLMLVATAMSGAHPLTDFNESLGAVVSYIRRAMLAASSTDIQRSALNALVHVLQSVDANPMLDLDEASDLLDQLTSEGWHGEHKALNELIAALLDDLDNETGMAIQAQLFAQYDAKAD